MTCRWRDVLTRIFQDILDPPVLKGASILWRIKLYKKEEKKLECQKKNSKIAQKTYRAKNVQKLN